MDLLLRKSDEHIIFTSVLVPTLSWVSSSTDKSFVQLAHVQDPITDKDILTRIDGTWVDGGSGIMPREGQKMFDGRNN